MKKVIYTTLLLALLCSCNPSNNNSVDNSNSSSLTSSSVNKVLTVEDVVSSLKSNFTSNYKSASGSYNFYRTENYFYDEELQGGRLILKDDSVYVYTMHNNVVVPRVPFDCYKEYYDNQYPEFKLNMDKFEIENDVYYTTDEENLKHLGLLVNSTGYAKAALFMDSGLLNLRLYNVYNKVEITAKIYAINSTKVSNLETYLNSNIDPETETIENRELIETLGLLNDNFTFIGQNNTTKEGLTLLVNENYVSMFTGDETDYEDYYGYIALEDGLHNFSIENDEVYVDFEIAADRDFIKDNYAFKRHDFTKFKMIDENTYISSDYYNVQNFCDLLTIDGTNINLVKLTINDNNSVNVSLMYNHYAVYEGVIYNIENSTIEALNDYVNQTVFPDLEHYENEALIEATKDLDMNFTYVNISIEDGEEDFYGIYSSNNGRKEYKEWYNNFPSTDYILYDDYAYSYVIDENKASPKYYDHLTRENYEQYYSFKSIDFTHFMPLGNNRWVTNSVKYMNILSKLLGSNPYESYHYQAYVELVDGVLYFEILDTSFGTNTKGYLKDINATQVDVVNEYKNNNEEPTIPNYTNNELISLINPVRETTNFTVKYHDDPLYDIYFGASDYDYWTEDTVYFGFYEAGFITSSKSKYIYEFAMIEDEDTNTKYLAISSHPSLYLNSISDFNPFTLISDEQINSFMPYEGNKYISYDQDIINIFVDVLQLGGSSLLGYSAVILEVINNELVISIVDLISISYDENGKRYEENEIFASATITNVGTTVIPSFAMIPEMK